MSNTVTALDTYSGKVAELPAVYLEIPAFAVHLVEVDPGTKSYDPLTYKSQTAEEFIASHSKARPARPADAEDSLESNLK